MTGRCGWGNFAAVAILCAGAYGLSEWRGGYSASFLFYGTAVLLAVSLGQAAFGMRRIEARRSLSQYRFFAGDDAHVIVDVSRSGPLPSGWMIVTDVWTDGGGEFRHSRMVLPGFRTAVRFRYKLSGLARGRYRFERFEIDSGDWFGLIRKKATVLAETEFVVYPKPLSLAIAPSGEADEAGRTALPPYAAREFAPLVASVRDYAAGDPLQRIHWKATARSGSFKTKEAEPLESARLAVVLDPSPGGFAGRDGDALYEAAVRAVAGLLEWTVGEGALASVHAGSAQELTLPPARRYDLLDVYELLSRARMGGAESGADLLLRESAAWPRGCTVVFVTRALDESLVRAANLLRAGRRRLAVWLVRPGAAAALGERERRLLEELERAGGQVAMLRAPAGPVYGAGGAEDVIA
ncbi:DUF58 domain-containing protein [Paenibacillus sp. GYB003]|uniref:DUF58 domain-containing protein n=1 Tax=Paenibacillus sp. GYB003 TaxID=2994392 RepID=UPI002F96624B